MTDDPFSLDDEDDKTVLQPRGGKSAPAPNPTRSDERNRASIKTYSSTENEGKRAAVSRPPEEFQNLPLLGGINPLEQAASRLLPLLITIKNTNNHPDPSQLRKLLIQELEEFKHRARDVLQDSKQVTQASYVMCTALDEAAMNTPWGHESNWAQHNLLSTFHNEVLGGERFFTLLRGLGKNPKENIDLLELMYVCITLGYEGTYRIAKNGQDTLLKIRVWLYNIIKNTRGASPVALAASWQGSEVKESKLPKMTTLWVGLAAASALASIVYISLLFKLGDQTENTVSGLLAAKAIPLEISKIEPPAVRAILPSAQAETSNNELYRQSLSLLLQSEISTGQIEVIEEFDRGMVRLLGDNLFGSGRASVNESIVPLIASVAYAMDQFPGVIVVTGHSDNIPIKTAKFPSNLALSQARANSISGVLGQTISDPSRLQAEGRGSNEPLADNSTKSGRSKNRRVELTLFY